MWAYDFTNDTAWQIHNGEGLTIGAPSNQHNNGNPGEKFSMVIDETIYFSLTNSTSGYSFTLWAHDTSNDSTWMVEAFNVSAYDNGLLDLVSVVGDTIYVCFSDGITGYELWAHDTSNHSTWQVADINSGSGDSNPGSNGCLLYTSPSPRDKRQSRMPSSA